MIEVIKIVTNERGRITHVVTPKGLRISLQQVAERIEAGEECVAVFNSKTRCPVTTALDASDRVVAVVHDPVGRRTLLDLPEYEDEGKDDFDAMFDELTGKTSDEDFGDDMSINEGTDTTEP